MHPVLKKALCALTSLVVTSCWFAYDTRQAENLRVESLLRWARQITQQTEALKLYAKEKNEPDPISWGVRYLMVGDETRPLWIKPYYEDKESTRPENFSFDSSRGYFYYSKILNTETNQGIQLKILSDPIGFLGSNSIWTNDLLVLISFLLIYASILSILPRETPEPNEISGDLEPSATKNEKISEATPSPKVPRIPNPAEHTAAFASTTPSAKAPVPDSNQWKAPILEWIQEAKNTLMSLGLSIKTMTQEAKNLAEIVLKSKTSLTLSLNTIKALKKTIGELELVAQNSGTSSKEPVSTPVGQLGMDAVHLYQLTAILKDLSEKTSNQIDGVLEEYQSAFDATLKLNESITTTNKNILQEAKLFQALKTKI
jgi:hypothetical protein